MIDYKISSFCNYGNCVEVGLEPGGAVKIRDTKDRSVSLTFTTDEWTAFVAGVKNGEFEAE